MSKTKNQIINCKTISELKPIKFVRVKTKNEEKIWNTLINEYHYLGHKRIIGRRIKYLILSKDIPIAAISFRSAYKRIEARDNHIGWTEEQRKIYLPNVVNNNRFLIPDYVKIPNLASHILSKAIMKVKNDWENIYKDKVYLLESYIDPGKYKGTCYKAGNWICVGKTKGYTTQKNYYKYHGNIKEVYLYVIERKYREIIGCKKIYSSRKSGKNIFAEEKIKMLIQDPGFNPSLIDWTVLNEETVREIAEELVTFHDDFRGCFKRIEQQILGQIYIQGLLSDIERKNIERVALKYLGPQHVRSLQSFISYYKWNDELMLKKIREQLCSLIGMSNGMINIDESDIPKKGKESVGVAKQYCGNTGKIDNCQAGIFLGYSSANGYGLIDKELYIPAIWFTEEYEERRGKVKLPENLKFKTKLEIAYEMFERIIKEKIFPFKWIGFDCTFGSDYDFCKKVSSLSGVYYFADIRCNTLIWQNRPETEIVKYMHKNEKKEKEIVKQSSLKPIKVCDLIKTNIIWKRRKISEGAKGPIYADIFCTRVILHRNGLPQDEVWLFIRKDNDGKIRYSISNAPFNIDIYELIEASKMRWPIEQCFEIDKKHLGMDHYENRSWIGWHKHMAYVFLAYLFLLKLQKSFKKKYRQLHYLCHRN